MKRSKIFKIILSVTMLLALLIVVGLVPINLWFAKAAIGRYAKENLDVDLVIQGALRLRLGPFSRLDAMAIEATKSGAVDEALVRIAALSAKPDLLGFLRGKVHLEEIRVAGARVDYCAALPTIESAGNDTQLSPSTSTNTPIAVDSFLLTNLQIYCGDQQDEQFPSISFEEVNGSAPTNEAIALEASAQIKEAPFQVTAQGGNLNTLLGSLDGFPLHLVVTAEGAEFSLTGEINQALDKLEVRAQSYLHAQDPQSLLADMGFNIPEMSTIDVSLQARLTDEAFEVEGFEAQIGENDVQGTGVARFSSERNFYALDAHVGKFDFASFGLESDQADAGDDSKSLDLQAIFLKLRSFDGRVLIMADQVTSGSAKLEGIELEASLGGGTLDISRLKMNVLGGSIDATVRLDTQAECEQFSSHAKASNIDLDLLAAMIEQEIPFTGSVGNFQIQTEGCGDSLRQLKKSARLEFVVSNTSLYHPGLNSAVSLDKFELSAGWSHPTRARIKGQIFEEHFSFELQGSTAEELLTGDPWPINIDTRGAGARLTIDGKVAVGNAEFVDLRLQLDAPRIGSLHRLIDVDPGSELPLSATTDFHWSNEELSLDDINVSVGKSVLSGRVEAIVADQETIFVTKVRSTMLDVVELEDMLQSSDDPAASPLQADQIVEDSDQSTSLLVFNLPSVDFELDIEQLDIPKFEIRDIEIRGRVRDKFLDDASVKIRVDDLLLVGEFDLDLRKQPGKISYQGSATNLNISDLLESLDIVNDTDISAQLLTIDYDTSGTTVQALATNGVVQLAMQNLKWDRGDSEIDLHIAELEVTAGPGRTTVWDAQGTLDDIPLAIRGEMPPLGVILYGDKTTQLTLAAKSENVVGMFSGELDWSNPDQFSSQLVLSGQRMDSEVIDLSLLESPLQGITISTDLVISDHEISATNVSANIGTSFATGSVKVLQSGVRRGLEVRLLAPRIQTLDLVPIVAALSDDQADEDPSDNEEQRDIDDVFWEFVDAQKSDRNIDLEIEVDEVYAGEDFMGGARIGLLADSDSFRLQPFVVSLPSGDIDIEYIEEKADEGYVSRLNMYIERLQYGDLARLYDPDAPKEMRGFVYLDTALTAAAPTVFELRDNLQGTIELLVIPEDINAGVLDLWAANLIVALMTPEDTGDPKKLNCMVAKFSVDEGVMKSKKVMLDSTDIIVRGKGEIDLAKRTIDLVAVPQAKLEKFFSMSTPIAVTGPWNDMQIGFGGAGIVGTLFRWYLSLIYVPYMWITGDRFPEDGLETCFEATDWAFVSAQNP